MGIFLYSIDTFQKLSIFKKKQTQQIMQNLNIILLGTTEAGDSTRVGMV